MTDDFEEVVDLSEWDEYIPDRLVNCTCLHDKECHYEGECSVEGCNCQGYLD